MADPTPTIESAAAAPAAIAPEGGSPLATAQAPAPEVVPAAPLAAETASEQLYKEPAAETAVEPAAAAEAAPALKAEDYKFTLPEGVSVDETILGEFKNVAADWKLDNAKAQSLVDMQLRATEVAVNATAEAIKTQWKTTIDTWKGEIDSDPVLGGSNKDKVLTTLGRALDEYGDKSTREAFDLTGAGWNPAILRFVHKMAAALSEGSPVPAGTPAVRKPTTLGTSLYPGT